ncbi:hypothetical protein BESB_026690 [Besnoitia besnoiti]|uniref:E3 ubiquitin-protein ligase n=1 Tax=Besnoitia besnoiti TaxID=94643 RepID=A0A2A9M136_BESBE|nr:uncharacterized protein BESB_026690 [Besnoitia besnoiti]PFH31695.1 hypothetical protein BESB_026690 [Besnoitia besnoiti]
MEPFPAAESIFPPSSSPTAASTASLFSPLDSLDPEHLFKDLDSFVTSADIPLLTNVLKRALYCRRSAPTCTRSPRPLVCSPTAKAGRASQPSLRAWLREVAVPCPCLVEHDRISMEDGGGGACGAHLKKGDIGFRCLDCEHDSTCVVCAPCFLNGDHSSHHYMIMQASGGCCDCGDPSSWAPSGFCSKHRGVTPEMDGPSSTLALPPFLRLRGQKHISSCIAFVTQRLRHFPRETLLRSATRRHLQETLAEALVAAQQELELFHRQQRERAAPDAVPTHAEASASFPRSAQSADAPGEGRRNRRERTGAEGEGDPVAAGAAAGSSAEDAAGGGLPTGDSVRLERDGGEAESFLESSESESERSTPSEEDGSEGGGGREAARMSSAWRREAEDDGDEENAALGGEGEGEGEGELLQQDASASVPARRRRHPRPITRDAAPGAGEEDVVGEAPSSSLFRGSDDRDGNLFDFQLWGDALRLTPEEVAALTIAAVAGRDLDSQSAIDAGTRAALAAVRARERAEQRGAASPSRSPSSASAAASLSPRLPPAGEEGRRRGASERGEVVPASRWWNDGEQDAEAGEEMAHEAEGRAGAFSALEMRRSEEDAAEDAATRAAVVRFSAAAAVSASASPARLPPPSSALSYASTLSLFFLDRLASSTLSPASSAGGVPQGRSRTLSSNSSRDRDGGRSFSPFDTAFFSSPASRAFMSHGLAELLELRMFQQRNQTPREGRRGSPSRGSGGGNPNAANAAAGANGPFPHGRGGGVARRGEASEGGERGERGERDARDFLLRPERPGADFLPRSSSSSLSLSSFSPFSETAKNAMLVLTQAVIAWLFELASKHLGYRWFINSSLVPSALVRWICEHGTLGASLQRQLHDFYMLLFASPKFKNKFAGLILDHYSHVARGVPLVDEESARRDFDAGIQARKRAREGVKCAGCGGASSLPCVWGFTGFVVAAEYSVQRLVSRHSTLARTEEKLSPWSFWKVPKRIGGLCLPIDAAHSCSASPPLASRERSRVFYRASPVQSCDLGSLTVQLFTVPNLAEIAVWEKDLVARGISFLKEAPTMSSPHEVEIMLNGLEYINPKLKGPEKRVLQDLCYVMSEETVWRRFFQADVLTICRILQPLWAFMLRFHRANLQVRHAREHVMYEMLHQWHNACILEDEMLRMVKRLGNGCRSSSHASFAPVIPLLSTLRPALLRLPPVPAFRALPPSSPPSSAFLSSHGYAVGSLHSPLTRTFVRFLCPDLLRAYLDLSSPSPCTSCASPPSLGSATSASLHRELVSLFPPRLAYLLMREGTASLFFAGALQVGYWVRNGEALMKEHVREYERSRADGFDLASLQIGFLLLAFQRRLQRADKRGERDRLAGGSRGRDGVPASALPNSAETERGGDAGGDEGKKREPVSVEEDTETLPSGEAEKNEESQGGGLREAPTSENLEEVVAREFHPLIVFFLAFCPARFSPQKLLERPGDTDASLSTSFPFPMRGSAPFSLFSLHRDSAASTSSSSLPFSFLPSLGHGQPPSAAGGAGAPPAPPQGERPSPPASSAAEPAASSSSLFSFASPSSAAPSASPPQAPASASFATLEKRAAEAILSFHAALLREAASHETVWDPAGQTIDPQSIAAEFVLLEMWKMLASVVASLFFLEKMNLHRLTARDKYLSRYSYLLRRQIVQLLALQPCTLARLERAVGRSGRLHPAFPQLLDELTTFSSLRSKSAENANAVVPQIRTSRGLLSGFASGGGGQPSAAAPLLRLKKESWKFFDAFGASDRLIAAGVSRKREHLGLARAEMHVAEEEALRHNDAPLLWPSREARDMPAEFFQMQDLVIDALVADDSRHLLFRLLVQLLEAKNRGPDCHASSASASGDSAAGLHSSLASPPAAVAQASSSSGGGGATDASSSSAVSPSASSSSSCGAFLHDAVCSALKLLDALVQAKRRRDRGELSDGEGQGECKKQAHETQAGSGSGGGTECSNSRGVEPSSGQATGKEHAAEGCEVIPPAFVRCLRAEVQRLHDAEATFAEVRRYCRTLLSRMALPVEEARAPSEGSLGAEETSWEVQSEARAQPGAAKLTTGVPRGGSQRAGAAGQAADTGVAVERSEKMGEGTGSQGGDEAAQEKRQEEKRAQAGKDEEAGLSEGARKQRQMLLAMQQRQRDFHCFLEDADMLSSSDEEDESSAPDAAAVHTQPGSAATSMSGESGSGQEQGARGAGLQPALSEAARHQSKPSDASCALSSSTRLLPLTQPEEAAASSSASVSAGEAVASEGASDPSSFASAQGAQEATGESRTRLQAGLSAPPLLQPVSLSPSTSSRRSPSKPSPQKLSLSRRQRLTKEEEEMRCGVCLEGHSAAQPLALLGHLSQTNMLRRLARKGRGSLPASHPAFSSCGHVAHVSCLHALQETAAAGGRAGGRNGEDAPGGRGVAGGAEGRRAREEEEGTGRARRAELAVAGEEGGEERRGRDKRRQGLAPGGGGEEDTPLQEEPDGKRRATESPIGLQKETLERCGDEEREKAAQDGGGDREKKKRGRPDGEGLSDSSGESLKARRKQRDSRGLQESDGALADDSPLRETGREAPLLVAPCDCCSSSPRSLWGCRCRQASSGLRGGLGSPPETAAVSFGDEQEGGGAGVATQDTLVPPRLAGIPSRAAASPQASSPSACASSSRFAWYGVWRPSLGAAVGRAAGSDWFKGMPAGRAGKLRRASRLRETRTEQGNANSRADRRRRSSTQALSSRLPGLSPSNGGRQGDSSAASSSSAFAEGRSPGAKRALRRSAREAERRRMTAENRGGGGSGGDAVLLEEEDEEENTLGAAAPSPGSGVRAEQREENGGGSKGGMQSEEGSQSDASLSSESLSQDEDYFPAEALADTEVEEANAQTSLYHASVRPARPIPEYDWETPRRPPARRGVLGMRTRRRGRRERGGRVAFSLSLFGGGELRVDPLGDEEDAETADFDSQDDERCGREDGHGSYRWGALCDECQFRNRFFRMHAFPPKKRGKKKGRAGRSAAACPWVPLQDDVDTLLCKRRNGGPVHPDFFIDAWRSIQRLGHVSWVSRCDVAQAFLDSAIGAFASANRRQTGRLAHSAASPWREMRELHYLPFYPCPSNWNLPPHPSSSPVTHAYFNFHTRVCDHTRRSFEFMERLFPSGGREGAGLTQAAERSRSGGERRDRRARGEPRQALGRTEGGEDPARGWGLLPGDTNFFSALFASTMLGRARGQPPPRGQGSAGAQGDRTAETEAYAPVASWSRVSQPGHPLRTGTGSGEVGALADAVPQAVDGDAPSSGKSEPTRRKETGDAACEFASSVSPSFLPLCPDCGGVRIARLLKEIETRGMEREELERLPRDLVEQLSPCSCWTSDELSAWRGAGAGLHMEILEWCAYASVLIHSSVDSPEGRREGDAESFFEDREPWVQVVRNCFLLDAFPARCFAWMDDITRFGYWSAANRFPRSYLQLATSPLTPEQDEDDGRRWRRERRETSAGQSEAGERAPCASSLSAAGACCADCRQGQLPGAGGDQTAAQGQARSSSSSSSSAASSGFSSSFLSSFFAASALPAVAGRHAGASLGDPVSRISAAGPGGEPAARRGSAQEEPRSGRGVGEERERTTADEEDGSMSSCSSNTEEESSDEVGETYGGFAEAQQEARERLRENTNELHWLPAAPSRAFAEARSHIPGSPVSCATEDMSSSGFSGSSSGEERPRTERTKGCGAAASLFTRRKREEEPEGFEAGEARLASSGRDGEGDGGRRGRTAARGTRLTAHPDSRAPGPGRSGSRRGDRRGTDGGDASRGDWRKRRGGKVKRRDKDRHHASSDAVARRRKQKGMKAKLSRKAEKKMNRERLRLLQIEETYPVWGIEDLDRKSLLFNPWACDIKAEFMKAFFTRCLKTPHQIRRRLSELLCIRALQLMDDVLVEEAGKVFASRFPAPASSAGEQDTFEFPIGHPIHREAFAAFWRDWLKPWEASGDLPGNVAESLPWYGFSYLGQLSQLRGALHAQQGRSPPAAPVKRHVFPVAPPSLCSLASSPRGWAGGTELCPATLPPSCLTETEKENLVLSSRYLSKCGPSCSKSGVQWLYRACRWSSDLPSLLAALSESQGRDGRMHAELAGEQEGRKSGDRGLASSASGSRKSPPLSACSPIYRALVNDVTLKADQNKEVHATPLLGASGAAYEGPDRLHRLDLLLGEGKTREAFWKLLAGKLPQKPSLLSLLEPKARPQTAAQASAAAGGGGPRMRSGDEKTGRQTACRNRAAERDGAGRSGEGARRTSGERGDPGERDTEVPRTETCPGRGRQGTEGQSALGSSPKDESIAKELVCETREQNSSRTSDREEESSGRPGARKGVREEAEVQSSAKKPNSTPLLSWWLQARAGSLPELFEALAWKLMCRGCLRYAPTSLPTCGGRACGVAEGAIKAETCEVTSHGDRAAGGGEGMDVDMGSEQQRPADAGGSVAGACAEGDRGYEWSASDVDVGKLVPAHLRRAPGDGVLRKGRKAQRGDCEQREATEGVQDESERTRRTAPFCAVCPCSGDVSRRYSSGPLRWSSFSAPEGEVRAYVQLLWQRFEARFIVAMASFLRFAVWLISAVWRLDSTLLSRLRASLRKPAGEEQLRLLLQILQLPLHFEEQEDCGAQKGEDEGFEANPRATETWNAGVERENEIETPRRETTVRKEEAEHGAGADYSRASGYDGVWEDDSTGAAPRLLIEAPDVERSCGESIPSSFSLPQPGVLGAFPCSPPRNTVLSTICRLMFSPLVVEGAATAAERRVELSPPSTDDVQLLPLHLPKDFLDLLRQTLLRKCPHCGDSPEHKALCLVCGAVVCVGSSCCKEEGSTREAAWGECMLHAHTCGGGSGIFLLVEQSMLFAVDGSSWFPLENVYVDDGGESDPRFRRGLERMTLHEACTRRLSWLLMNGRLLPFVSRSYIRPFSLSDAMTVRWP